MGRTGVGGGGQRRQMEQPEKEEAAEWAWRWREQSPSAGQLERPPATDNRSESYIHGGRDPRPGSSRIPWVLRIGTLGDLLA